MIQLKGTTFWNAQKQMNTGHVTVNVGRTQASLNEANMVQEAYNFFGEERKTYAWGLYWQAGGDLGGPQLDTWTRYCPDIPSKASCSKFISASLTYAWAPCMRFWQIVTVDRVQDGFSETLR